MDPANNTAEINWRKGASEANTTGAEAEWENVSAALGFTDIPKHDPWEHA